MTAAHAVLCTDVSKEPKPRYAPGVLIVKFKEPVADELKAALVRGEPLHQVSTTASLDALNAKYGLESMRMLFRSLIVKDADGRVTHVETMAEHTARIREKFPVRGARSAAQYTGPDLTTFFKLRVQQEASIQAVAEQYRSDPGVEYASPDYEAKLLWNPNDHFYNTGIPGSWGQPYSDLWGIKKIRCGEAWDASRGSGVIIAVIDTGTWYRYSSGEPPGVENYDGHPDLKPNLWVNYYEYEGPPYYGRPGYDDDGNGYVDDIYGYNFVDEADDPEEALASDPMDFIGHGTHVAGTAAAVGNNTVGVVGVAPQAKIMTLKVFWWYDAYQTEVGDWSWVAEAIEYAMLNGADVLNLSLSGPGKPYDVVSAIGYAYSSGCVIVAAAGNDRINANSLSPANLWKTVTVSATGQEDAASYYSNYGTVVDVAAPGGGAASILSREPEDVNILSLRSCQVNGGFDDPEYWLDDPNDPHHAYLYVRAQGTSMACPHVAASAALILSINPYLNPEEVRTCIRKSAVDLGEYGFDEYYGFGRLDARAAVERTYSASYDCQALIIDPEDGDVFVRPQEGETVTIDVYGIADSDYWDYFPHGWQVDYKPKYGTSGWAQLNSGDERGWWYYGTYMGSINVNDVPDGAILIRLTVYGMGYEHYYDYKTVTVCTARNRLMCPSGEDHPVASAPLIADLSEAHAGREIFVGTYERGEYPGFYRAITSSGGILWQDLREYGSGTMSSANSADLDSDPDDLEVVLGTGDPPEQGGSGGGVVRAYHADGGQYWEYVWMAVPSVQGSAAVADLVGDDAPEVVIAADNNVHCLSSAGAEEWVLRLTDLGYPNAHIRESSCAVADMDEAIPGLEIAVGSQEEGPFDRMGKLYVLKRNAEGTGYEVHSAFTASGSVYSSPAVADLLADYAGLEVVVGTNGGKLDCFSPAEGATCWRYNADPDPADPAITADVRSSPAIADLDGDGHLEIVFGCDIGPASQLFGDRSSWIGKVVCLRADGALAWHFETRHIFHLSSPAIADLDPSHPGLEVAIGDLGGRVYVLHGDDGTLFWAFDTIPLNWFGLWSVRPQCSPVIADIRPDIPGLELAVAPDDGYLYIFNFPGTGTEPWPMFHGNRRRTGLYGDAP